MQPVVFRTTSPVASRMPAPFRFAGLSASLCALLLSGCASSQLHSARMAFYQGQPDQAELVLKEVVDDAKGGKDQNLAYMERGAIRQATGRYEDSISDLRKAVEMDNKLETKSATEQGASMLANDYTISYRGPPFERVMVHTLLAQDYLALGKWQDAGVEARNIIEHLQELDGFPDDAYSRYLAGFCLEIMDDRSNANLQYRNAATLLTNAIVRVRNGILEESAQPPGTSKRGAVSNEFICFVMIGRSPTGYDTRYSLPVYTAAPYAEFYAPDGTLMGRSYPLVNTADLIRLTKSRTAVRDAAKTVARIATKEIVADQIRQRNEGLGNLVELVLLAMETPDDRRWETLPLWFQVARIQCPADLAGYDVVFKYANGAPYRRKVIAGPVPKRRNMYISVCRDIP